jgi:hypothetical protein
MTTSVEQPQEAAVPRPRASFRYVGKINDVLPALRDYMKSLGRA